VLNISINEIYQMTLLTASRSDKIGARAQESINADPDGAFKENVVPGEFFTVEDNLNRQMLDDHLGFVDTRFSVLV